MYFGKPISPRPCPPSPRNDYNASRSRSKLRVYNPNTSLRNNSQNSSQLSFGDTSIDESPNPSPQLHFSVQKMTLSISPRPPLIQSSSAQNDIFNQAYYKRHKTNKRTDENNSNPYLPVQPLTDDRIEQIKAILKMEYNEKSYETSVIEDQTVDELLSRIENRIQALTPSYFNTNNSGIPSTPTSSVNNFSSSYKLSAVASGLQSPKSPRKQPSINNLCQSCSEFQPLQFGNDSKSKKKLRICRSPSADIEKYIRIDKNGHDDLDRRIIELKGRFNKISELINARNANS